MTKERPPISFTNSLVEIAAVLTFERMAAIVGRSPRTVRNWSDPDSPESCPIDCALQLDLAYRQAGADGAPMLDTLALLYDEHCLAIFGGQLELASKLKIVIKEGSEAHNALLDAILPGASDADRDVARREVEEGIAALKATLPLLTKGAGPDGRRGESDPLGGKVT